MGSHPEPLSPVSVRARTKLWFVAAVWFRLKLQAKDGRTLQEKKRYLVFWLERFVRHEPGSLLTTVFDMSESGLGNVVRLSLLTSCLD